MRWVTRYQMKLIVNIASTLIDVKASRKRVTFWKDEDGEKQTFESLTTNNQHTLTGSLPPTSVVN